MKLTYSHLIWFAIFLTFFFKALNFLDPDFGWHYQMGKIIIAHGIPKADQFSYTMPNFSYIDHEWLTDIFIYKFYSVFGMIGLAIVWSLIGVFTLYISISTAWINKTIMSKVKDLVYLPILLLGAGGMLGQFGIRPQVISWLCLAILLYQLNIWEKSKWVKILIPIFFLIWVNLHGGFALGIAFFGFFLVIKTLRTKRISLLEFMSFGSSLFITLINPYGIGLWREVFDTFFSTPLHSQIEEWMPVWMAMNVCYPFILVLGVVFITRYRKFLFTEFICIFLISLTLSFNALFYLPLFVTVSMPFLVTGLLLFENEITSIKFGPKHFKIALKFLLGLSLFLFMFSAFFALRNALKLSERAFYPKNAILYIRNNMVSGQIFAPYNWGGYLIWKLPEKKVFIDGRMAHWPGILDEEYKIVLGKKNYKEVFAKYNIQMILWPKETKKTSFISKIENDGWKVVYTDSVSDVLVR